MFSSKHFPELNYPLRMRPGQAAGQLLVSLGDRVEMGQCLALPGEPNGARIHCAAPGWVEAIESRPEPNGGGEVATVVVRTDPGEHRRPDTWFESPNRAPSAVAAIQRAGIVGHGGGGFPLHRKLEQVLNSGVETHLVVNAVECEAPISCDRAMLAECGAGVVAGAQELAKVLGLDRFVLALGTANAALGKRALGASGAAGADAECVEVGEGYTLGDERILLARLFGRPFRGRPLPCQDGYLVVNVGTALAVYRTLRHGEPLIYRYVTLLDVERGMRANLRLPIGARIGDALAFAGVALDGVRQVVVGGHRMGRRDVDVMAPIAATTNCVIVHRSDQEPALDPVGPCIRCGRCDEACPYGLPAQALIQLVQARATQFADLSTELQACTSCRSCDLVCPSRIPLADWFQLAKGQVSREQATSARAARARQRFEGHHARRQQRRAPVIPALDDKPSRKQPGRGSPVDNGARDEVARAVVRVREKRARRDVSARAEEKVKLD